MSYFFKEAAENEEQKMRYPFFNEMSPTYKGLMTGGAVGGIIGNGVPAITERFKNPKVRAVGEFVEETSPYWILGGPTLGAFAGGGKEVFTKVPMDKEAALQSAREELQKLAEEKAGLSKSAYDYDEDDYKSHTVSDAGKGLALGGLIGGAAGAVKGEEWLKEIPRLSPAGKRFLAAGGIGGMAALPLGIAGAGVGMSRDLYSVIRNAARSGDEQ